MKFVDANSVEEQVVHVTSEAIEVCNTILLNDRLFRTAEELVDLIASSVTGLRILAEKYGVDVDDVVDHVNAKNSSRGYHS